MLLLNFQEMGVKDIKFIFMNNLNYLMTNTAYNMESVTCKAMMRSKHKGKLENAKYGFINLPGTNY